MEGLAAVVRDIGLKYSRLAKYLGEYRRVAGSDSGGLYQKQALLTRIRVLVDAVPDSVVKEQLCDWCRNEAATIEQEREEFKFRFTREVVTTLRELGMEVRGQIPLLRVGFFTVKVDLQQGTGVIYWGPEIERLRDKVSLVPTELATVLQEYRQRLLERADTELPKFIKVLYSAYRRCCLWADVPLGTRIPLADMLRELVMMMQPPAFQIDPVRATFVEYPRVQFSYDLFRLRQAGLVEVGGTKLRLHVATFDATAEKMRALWVPDNERGEGTHYSHISFVAIVAHDDSTY